MTIRLLRTLVAIADVRTFSAAADIVHMTHAAVRKQMQTLEANLGVSLFNRTTRTPKLTPIALEVVRKARSLIAGHDNLVPSILANDGLSGAVPLGVSRTTLTELTPQVLVRLAAQYPNLSLHIKPGLTEPLVSDVQRGNLKAAIITKPHLMPVGIRFRELTQEPMQLIASIKEIETDPIARLNNRPFIRFNRNAVLGTLIDNWVNSKRLRVNANLGVSIVSDLSVTPRNRIPVKRLPLGPKAPVRSIGLAYHKDQIKTPVIDVVFAAFADIIATERTTDGGNPS